MKKKEIYNLSSFVNLIRSLSIMGGSLLSNLVFSRFPPLLFLSVAIVANGITLALIPMFQSFALMNVAVAATGLTFGTVDMGIQALILKSWGEKKSPKLIQLFHAMFAIGGLVAPLIAQPFIPKTEVEKLPNSCSQNGSDIFNEVGK